MSDQGDDGRDDDPDGATGGDGRDDTAGPTTDGPTTDENGNAGVDDSGVGVDLPADVEVTLTQLLSEAATAARARDTEDVSAVVDTVETVARNKVPPGDLREQLEHGCAAVQRVVADEPLVAAEYLDAMVRRVQSA